MNRHGSCVRGGFLRAHRVNCVRAGIDGIQEASRVPFLLHTGELLHHLSSGAPRHWGHHRWRAEDHEAPFGAITALGDPRRRRLRLPSAGFLVAGVRGVWRSRPERRRRGCFQPWDFAIKALFTLFYYKERLHL